MTNHSTTNSGQLSFDDLLGEAASENAAYCFERETGHLPSDYDEAMPFFRDLVDRHHAAMLIADVGEVRRLREEAGNLAQRLNGGEAGILAHDDAPGYVLARSVASQPDSVPLWGEEGSFVITAGTMRVRIEIEGMFGIGVGAMFWPGFSAHIVDPDKPFLSDTGYRSFLGIAGAPVAGMTPDTFAREVINAYINSEKNI